MPLRPAVGRGQWSLGLLLKRLAVSWMVAPVNVIAGEVYIMYVDNFSSNGQSFNLSWQLSNGASLDCTLFPVNW